MRKFDDNTETRTRMFSKRDLQRVLKDFRDNGYTVEKGDNRYEVLDGDRLVFSALNGSRAYLVRLDKGLLAEEASA